MRRSPRLQPGGGGDGGSPPDAPAAGAALPAPLAPPASAAAAAAPCHAEIRGRRCRPWALWEARMCPQQRQWLCASLG